MIGLMHDLQTALFHKVGENLLFSRPPPVKTRMLRLLLGLCQFHCYIVVFITMLPNRSPGQLIIAQATPPGTSALGMVRASGEGLLGLTESLTGKAQWTARTPRLCWLYDSEGHKFDQALVTYFAAPASYTGEDMLEISTHGNPLIVQTLLETCLRYGAELAEPGEFTKRAYLNGKLALDQAEMIANLIHSRSEKLLQASLRSMEGKFQEHVSTLHEKITLVLTLLQGHLDFPVETEDEFDEGQIHHILHSCRQQLYKLCQVSRSSALLYHGLETVISGSPNVGKSSLLNAMLGCERALVSETAGTTRDYLQEQIVFADMPLQLIDTAGLRRNSLDNIEQAGIQKTYQRLEDADLILFIFDASKAEFTAGDQALLETVRSHTPAEHTLLLGNKTDLLSETQQASLSETLQHRQQAQGLFTDFALISCHPDYPLGLEPLERLFQKINPANYLQGDFELALSQRQTCLLQNCLHHIDQIANPIVDYMAAVSELESTLECLGRLAGQALSPADSLEQIFSQFCIGK